MRFPFYADKVVILSFMLRLLCGMNERFSECIQHSTACGKIPPVEYKKARSYTNEEIESSWYGRQKYDTDGLVCRKARN